MSKEKILIVDDNPINIKALLEILKTEESYIFLIATNGQKALEVAQTEQPDLILLDILMPDLNGYEVCTYLKQDVQTEHIPVIFITALDSDVDESKGFEVGAVDYIQKPVNALTAKARVKTHLELKKQRDILKNISSIDGLTGIYNRGYFNEILMNNWESAKRTGAELALIMVDIDYFKLFNDNYGHVGGDNCLKAVASALNGVITRNIDACYRYGGEEFVTLLPATSLEGALKIAEKQQEAVNQLKYSHESSKVSDYVTISLGVASVQPKKYDKNVEALILLADSALYKAKDAGRNCIKLT